MRIVVLFIVPASILIGKLQSQDLGFNRYYKFHKGFYEIPGFSNQVDSVSYLLLNHLSSDPLLIYCVCPSFSSEYAYSIDQKNGEYIFRLDSLSENYWYAKDKSIINTYSIEKIIDSSFVSEMYRVLLSTITYLADSTRSNNPASYRRNDGTSIFLSINDSYGNIVTQGLDAGPIYSFRIQLFCERLFEFLLSDKNDYERFKLENKELIEVVKSINRYIVSVRIHPIPLNFDASRS